MAAVDALAITMYRGDSYPLSFTVKDKLTKLPINLSGATAKMTVSSAATPIDDSTKLFTLNGTVDADPALGKIFFTPTATNTANIGKFFYDVQIEGADNTVRTVAKSTFTIIMDITK